MTNQKISVLKLSLRQIAFATIMGSLAFAVRNTGFYIIIYDPFRFDPRWVFSLLAACWTGPTGGLIAGTLAAMKLDRLVQADLAAIPAHFLVGLSGRWLTTHKKSSVYASLLWPILGVPLYWLTTLLFTPASATLTLIPVLAFIGVTSAALTFVVGTAVEKRAADLLNRINA